MLYNNYNDCTDTHIILLLLCLQLWQEVLRWAHSIPAPEKGALLLVRLASVKLGLLK
jgi:hypothetical protein